MINTTGINSYSQSATTQDSTIKESLGKDDFLNLLVTQLKNQDPLNPVDSAEFTAQLAQFSSLEQLYNVNSNLGTLGEIQKGSNNSQAVSYIGKKALSYGNSIDFTQGEEADISFGLEADASSVSINISDAQGNLIRKIENGPTGSGKTNFTWDGLNDDGAKAADGIYTVDVLAYDKNNDSVNCVPYVSSTISGISFEQGETYLNSGQLKIPLSSVFNISNEQS